jgi:hypothetical protein
LFAAFKNAEQNIKSKRYTNTGYKNLMFPQKSGLPFYLMQPKI